MDTQKTALKNGIMPRLEKHKRTFGQIAADGLTSFCGSWTFILLIFVYIGIWIALNLVGWFFHWDPWPFIILNLTLSCLAGIQAPIILMSQNRGAQKDRHRQEYDYLVDKKTLKTVNELMKTVSRIERKIK